MNARFDALGRDLKERLGRQQASLELRQEARRGAEELRSWLSEREDSLRRGQTSSPSRPEAVRAQAQHNKVRPVETLQLLQPRELPVFKTTNLFLCPTGSAGGAGRALQEGGGPEGDVKDTGL